jgi:hypothetical protein
MRLRFRSPVGPDGYRSHIIVVMYRNFSGLGYSLGQPFPIFTGLPGHRSLKKYYDDHAGDPKRSLITFDAVLRTFTRVTAKSLATQGPQ